MLQPMRVAVDVTPLLGPRTGIGELVAGLVDGLHRRTDVEVIPVALSWRGRGEAGATHRPIPARLIQTIWARSNLLPVTTWTGGVDVVHGTNYVVGPASRNNTPRIVTVHDLATVKTPHLCHPATLVFPNLVKRAVASGAVVQTDSDTTAKEVQEWLQISADRIRAVHPGVVTIPDGSSTGLDPRIQTAPFLLTLGTEEPRKGLNVLASAFSRIKAAHPELLWVHAGNSGWGSEELSEAIRALPDDDRQAVVRLGRVTNDQRAWLLRNTRVFVYPSVDEGFGFPPLEALSVGTPVVVSDLAVLRETLSSQASFAELGNVEHLAQTVLETLERTTTAASALERIQHSQRFTWDNMATAQVQWYADVLSRRTS
jgi:glycosyltransferase involved in cell wall biosynthesis